MSGNSASNKWSVTDANARSRAQHRFDDAVGDTLDHAVYRVTEVLLSRQHCGKQDEQRERDLKRQKLS